MKLRWWIVPVLVAAVLLTSYGLAKTIQFATQTITVEGHAGRPGADLRTVRFNVEMLKCWGTSNTFTEMMAKEEGVTEIKTYTRTNTAVITYDPALTSPERLAERINAPVHNAETGETTKIFTVREIET